MMHVRVHTLLGHLAVSVWCQDVSIGHDHCVWSSRRWVEHFEAWEQAEIVSDALRLVATLARRGELDELTDDCWV